MANIEFTESSDWKDLEGQFDSIKEALMRLGVFMIENPAVEGTDSVSWVFFTKKVQGNDIKSEVNEYYGSDDDEDDEFLVELKKQLVTDLTKEILEHI